MSRPLDRFRSIKTKLSVLIFIAVSIAVMVVFASETAGVRLRVSSIVALVLSLAAVRVFARGLTSPLREMAEAATAMARGDYSRRVAESSRDEIGELARAFNAMASELAEVDRLRRDLVANVSHELRTPITALRAVLENLVDGVERPEPETLRTMLDQVQRLGRLVDQLLDLSRLESGAVPLERRDVEVRPLLEQVLRESRLREQDVRLRIDAAAGLVADADPERVHQVIANLVENAVRHSPDGGEVVVAAARDDGRVRIEVCDEGPGIPPEERTRVFERFYRADVARSSNDGGTGLGLAIARWIVDLHGGEIRAEPRDPRGCRMVVVLPGRAA